jgi:hypothetical protein
VKPVEKRWRWVNGLRPLLWDFTPRIRRRRRRRERVTNTYKRERERRGIKWPLPSKFREEPCTQGSEEGRKRSIL